MKNIHYSDGFLQNLHPGGFREVGQILLINIRNTVSFICSLLNNVPDVQKFMSDGLNCKDQQVSDQHLLTNQFLRQ